MSDDEKDLSVAMEASRKKGSEKFTANGKDLAISLLEFWQWSASDLTNNALRGKLAEFIVANALGVTNGIRVEWDAYDLLYGDKRIEVKSSAYVQSWEQKKHSNIVFGVRPTRMWTEDQRFNNDCIRQSDIYVFCVLVHRERETVDPLNLDQWEFYVIRTHILNDLLGNQKTLTLGRLEKLRPLHVTFGDLKQAIDSIS